MFISDFSTSNIFFNLCLDFSFHSFLFLIEFVSRHVGVPDNRLQDLNSRKRLSLHAEASILPSHHLQLLNHLFSVGQLSLHLVLEII